MLLRLHMIVKNEAQRIKATLESVRPWVDGWTILDTGSTDGTQEIIREVMGDVPGELFEEPIITYLDTGIIDFAATRNRGLELAGEGSTFLLLLNGDDALLDGEQLRKFCQEKREDRSGAYFLRVVGCPRGEYDSSRLMRTSAGWRYTMVTHEVLCGSTPVLGRAPARIHHEEAPLANRISRWQQDVVVLPRWLQEHPEDARAIFYLAQTYECLGEYAQAVPLYLRRVEIGGWAEEVYEARRRAAQCSGHLGRPWPEVQQLYLDAHAGLPRRAEALYAVAEHWHRADNHALAYLFASRVDALPVPERDSYFVDREAHEWRAADIMAVHGFYLDEREAGRKAAAKAARAQPYDLRIRRNQHFYLLPLTEQPGVAVIPLEPEVLEPGWTACNPSVSPLGIVVRAVNYKIRPDGSYDYDGTIRTRNYLSVREPGFYRKAREIQDKTNLPRTDFPVHGFEDCRLFQWRGARWLVCTVRDTTVEGICEQALLRLDAAGDVCEMTLLRGPWSSKNQKNWKPAADGDRLRWIYSTDPLTVFDHGTIPTKLEHSGRLLGSSQAVKISEGWLWVDHEVSWNDKGRDRIYAHRFVLADAELTRVEAISDPFCFEQRGVEFCAGLSVEAGSVAVSYAVKDASAKLVELPLAQVLGMRR